MNRGIKYLTSNDLRGLLLSLNTSHSIMDNTNKILNSGMIDTNNNINSSLTKNSSSSLSSKSLQILPLNKRSFMIIDVRDDDYSGGHINGSLNIPSRRFSESLSILIKKILNTTPIINRIIFHCMFSQQRGPAAAGLFKAEWEEMMKRLKEKVKNNEGNINNKNNNNKNNETIDNGKNFSDKQEAVDNKINNNNESNQSNANNTHINNSTSNFQINNSNNTNNNTNNSTNANDNNNKDNSVPKVSEDLDEISYDFDNWTSLLKSKHVSHFIQNPLQVEILEGGFNGWLLMCYKNAEVDQLIEDYTPNQWD